jgi:hypothetical protein
MSVVEGSTQKRSCAVIEIPAGFPDRIEFALEGPQGHRVRSGIGQFDLDQCGERCEFLVLHRSGIISGAVPMVHVVFRCSTTGMNVQHWVDDDTSRREDTSGYDAVSCPACARLHFVHRATGTTLGQRDKQD